MDKQLKNSLRRAVEQLPRADLQALWEKPVEPLRVHDAITRPDYLPHRPTQQLRRLVPAFACLALFLCGGFGWYGQTAVAATVIDFELNPSIEITLNRRETVLKVEGLNPEAVEVLAGKSYRGEEAEDVIEEITRLLQASGYLNESKNTIFLSVNGKNVEKAEELSEELSEKIRLLADKEQSPTDVLRQSGKLDKALREQATEYALSPGKLRLAALLAEQLSDYSTAELLSFTPAQLLALADSLGTALPDGLVIEQSRFLKTEGREVPAVTPDETLHADEAQSAGTTVTPSETVTSQPQTKPTSPPTLPTNPAPTPVSPPPVTPTPTPPVTTQTPSSTPPQTDDDDDDDDDSGDDNDDDTDDD